MTKKCLHAYILTKSFFTHIMSVVSSHRDKTEFHKVCRTIIWNSCIDRYSDNTRSVDRHKHLTWSSTHPLFAKSQITTKTKEEIFLDYFLKLAETRCVDLTSRTLCNSTSTKERKSVLLIELIDKRKFSRWKPLTSVDSKACLNDCG